MHQSHQKHEKIKALLTDFPIRDELLINPSVDLYEGFCVLETAYKQLVGSRREQSELDECCDQLTNQARGLLTVLGITANGDNNNWIELLTEVLNDGKRYFEVALKAKQELEVRVRPQLAITRVENQRLEESLKKLDRQLMELGSGSVQQGINKVQEYLRLQAKIAQSRQKIKARYPDLALIETELEKQGWNSIKADFEDALEDMGARIRSIKTKLNEIDTEIEEYPIQYFGIDEPIRRFLLYGGCTAEDFLVDSVKLYAEVKAGEKAEHVPDLKLRHSVILRFQKWWEFFKSREEHKVTGEEELNPDTPERYRSPTLIFDTETMEILVKFPTQRCLRPDRDTGMYLEVYCADLQKPDYVGRLSLYRRPKGLIETLPLEFTLPGLSSSYRFLLTSGKSIIHEWNFEIPGNEIQYMAFFAELRKYINEEYLPKTHLIIVLKDDIAITPQECILVEGGRLFGKWKEYCWYQVDLSEIDEFILTDEHGRLSSIPLISYNASSIGFNRRFMPGRSIFR